MRGAIAALGALVAATVAGGTSAAAQDVGCRLLPGTYVTTITDIEGVFASRSIVTLAPGGVLISTDSRQGGQAGVYEPFSAGQGAWRCDVAGDGTVTFEAVSLTFATPHETAASSFARVDYEGVLDPATGHVEGKLSLRLSSARDLEGADPMNTPGEVVETFDFSGERVLAP